MSAMSAVAAAGGGDDRWHRRAPAGVGTARARSLRCRPNPATMSLVRTRPCLPHPAS